MATPGDVRCPHCHGDVPAAPYCVRCGEPLADRASPGPSEARGYAALPSERWFAPRIVSSIFPHLPRADMSAFRGSLLVGVAAIVGLCAFELFSLALVVAAVVVPVLFVLYLWDVDLYEDAPLPVLVATIAWGAAAGVGLGLLARHQQTPFSPFEQGVATHDLIWLGLVLPLAGFVLMLLGPLALLPYKRFNDVLDGVTFGAASAVTFLAAESITNSFDVLRDGVRAPGDEGLWIARLLTLGVALPVLGAGVAASACAVLWLRYRGPAADRPELGIAGRLSVALPLAAAALVGASLSVLYLSQWEAFGITAVLAAAALVALRRVVDLGLRQEAAEIAVGPPIHCSNCGHETPGHTFCAHCGVALRALPKSGATGSPSPRSTGARIPRAVLPAAFALLIAATIGISLVVIELIEPDPVAPPCETGVFCSSAADAGAASSPRLYVSKTWRSAIGPSLSYDVLTWSEEKVAENAILLGHRFNGVGVWVIVTRSAVTREALLASGLKIAKDSTLGLELDDDKEHVVLNPQIGFVPAAIQLHRATVNKPPSPSKRLEFVFEAATKGAATVLVEVVTAEVPKSKGDHARSPFPSLAEVDTLLDTFDWGVGT